MAAIITEQFRINSRKRLMQDITDNNYYVSIGKQDSWAELNLGQTIPTSPLPLGTRGDAAEVRNNISALFKIVGSKVSNMLPNYIIQPDRNYKVYNPYDPTCFYASADEFPCFVISRLDSLGGGTGDHVFLCVGKRHTATVAGYSFNELGSPTENTDVPGIWSYSEDGYRWLYLGKYSAAYTSVNNGAFVSYDFEQDVIDPDEPIQTYSPGLIHGFHIINDGVGLTNATAAAVNVTLTGLRDGTKTILADVPCLLKIENNRVVKISIADSVDVTSGTNYKEWSNVTARITTGTYATTGGVVIVPIVSPIDGYEKHLETCLPSWYIGVGADTLNAQYIPSGTSYRQIAIVKNPKRNNLSALNDATVDVVDKSFSRTGNDADDRIVWQGYDVDVGWKLKQGDYAVATISGVEFKNNKWHYYYYNSLYAGMLDIDASLPLDIIAPDDLVLGVNNTKNLLSSEYELNPNSTLYDKTSGEVLFIDNRGAITREQGQNEEIKIIIQL